MSNQTRDIPNDTDCIRYLSQWGVQVTGKTLIVPRNRLGIKLWGVVDYLRNKHGYGVSTGRE
jgi:uncharacterized protein (DUF486 family)